MTMTNKQYSHSIFYSTILYQYHCTHCGLFLGKTETEAEKAEQDFCQIRKQHSDSKADTLEKRVKFLEEEVQKLKRRPTRYK
jgi:hypothetical protein